MMLGLYVASAMRTGAGRLPVRVGGCIIATNFFALSKSKREGRKEICISHRAPGPGILVWSGPGSAVAPYPVDNRRPRAGYQSPGQLAYGGYQYPDAASSQGDW